MVSIKRGSGVMYVTLPRLFLFGSNYIMHCNSTVLRQQMFMTLRIELQIKIKLGNFYKYRLKIFGVVPHKNLKITIIQRKLVCIYFIYTVMPGSRCHC